MALDLWIETFDEELFKNICQVSLKQYNDHLLTGKLDNEGTLSKFGKKFVLGRKEVWIPKSMEKSRRGYSFVRINNNSSYPLGLILTPYSDIDVKYHRNSRTIDQKTNFERIELFGSDQDDFIERVFKTYKNSLVHKPKEKDNHFILYSSDREV